MLPDVVVDTNVLMHADDDRQTHQEDARALLQDLLDGRTFLCVDEGFAIEEGANRSLIGGEYFQRLNATHTAMAVLAQLFAGGAVRLVSKTVPRGVKKHLEQTIRNKRDRTFLAVAHNSQGHVLCSHDSQDMQEGKRGFLKAKVDVDVLFVHEVRALL